MTGYNAPFFNALSCVFLTYRRMHGEEEALRFIHEVFSQRLGPVYDSWGFRKGDEQDFARVVGRNDKLLGLAVSLDIQPQRIIYRFHTDPFPLLKGLVDAARFDRTYLDFKVSHLLGADWSYTTPHHLWKGEPYTEHVIVKGKSA
jgi:hypothetical protein